VPVFVDRGAPANVFKDNRACGADAWKTRISVKTKKLCGKAIVRGDAGTAPQTVGLLGGILTYVVKPESSPPILPIV